MTLRLRLRLLMAVLAPLVVATATPVAAHDSPRTGELVDYPMPFPVIGDHWFYDSFWEPRPGGRLHAAIDIFADKGTDVVAVADGVIRLANGSDTSVPPDRCCSLVITHDDGWESVYLHLNNDTPGTDDGLGWGIADGLAPGVRIGAGQLIGWVGDSGNAETTPPHLHLELRDPAGVTVNPFLALQAAGDGRGGNPRPPLYAGTQVVRLGDEGTHIAQLQEDLTRLGIETGGVDGRFGPLTERGVREFQERHRLDTDGLVGELTRGAMAGLVRSGGSVVGFGASGDDVAETQRLLHGLGVDPGPVDGSFGPQTLQAVLAFQRIRSLAIDGLVGPLTRSALSE